MLLLLASKLKRYCIIDRLALIALNAYMSVFNIVWVIEGMLEYRLKHFKWKRSKSSIKGNNTAKPDLFSIHYNLLELNSLLH